MEYEEEPCRDLRDLLAGTLHAEYFSDIEQRRQHWQECEKCQASLPYAAAQLQDIEDYVLSQIRRNVERLHQQYSSEKPSILAPPERNNVEPPALARRPVIEFVPSLASNKPSESEDPHMRLLILLAQKGEALRQQLQIMNDNWGLDQFRVAPGDDGEYDSRVCGSLIASLKKEVGHFVFEAILAADLLNLFKGEFEGNFPPRLGRTMLRTVERAAPEFLRLYLDNESKSSFGIVSTSEKEQFPTVPEGVERIAGDLKDATDSIKAVQMEILRRLNGSIYQDTEIDEDLGNLLGKELFGNLTSHTRELLNRAEHLFRTGKEWEEFRPSIQDFHDAYEYEFRNRISGPLARKLIENGHTDYPPAGAKSQLLVGGKFNGAKLSLGDQLWFLRNDEVVRNIVSDMGFDVKEIHRSASKVIKIRNDAAHGRACSDEEARNIRDMLLGTRSCLKTLFPISKR